jgi:hypothetical protein
LSDPNPARSVLIGLAQRPHLLTAQTRHLRNLHITEHAELEEVAGRFQTPFQTPSAHRPATETPVFRYTRKRHTSMPLQPIGKLGHRENGNVKLLSDRLNVAIATDQGIRPGNGGEYEKHDIVGIANVG